MSYSNKTLIIHMTEKTLYISIQRIQWEYHYKLTIHSICHATVSGDTISEIFNFKSSLKTTCKESSKWSDKGGECCQDEDMKLNRCNDDRIRDWKEFSK